MSQFGEIEEIVEELETTDCMATQGMRDRYSYFHEDESEATKELLKHPYIWDKFICVPKSRLRRMSPLTPSYLHAQPKLRFEFEKCDDEIRSRCEPGWRIDSYIKKSKVFAYYNTAEF